MSALLFFLIFGVIVMVGAGVVLNQVSDWLYSTYSVCARWLSKRVRS